MNRSAVLPFLFLLSVFTHAQDRLPVFGNPDRTELEMKECSFDKNADAIKLLDYQEKEVIADYGLKVKTVRRVKIKILNKNGYPFATVVIPYANRARGTRITDITAYIHYLDSAGNIISEKVDKKQIFRDKESETTKKIKFTFPNLRPGSVVEYRYEKTEKNSLHIEPWFFQDFIPTVYSLFHLIIPARMDIDRKIIGVDSIEEKSKLNRYSQSFNNTIEHTYSLQNVHAFRPEPFMTSIADNLQRIEFAVQGSGLGFGGFGSNKSKWRMLARVLNEIPLFGKQFNMPIPGTEQIIDSAKKFVTAEDKINFIYRRVKERIKWDEQQTFYSGNLTDAWKEQTGNSAEINLIILNLLRKTGVSCSPIMISTKSNGLPDENFFSLSQFNGVDVLILDSTANYILDGTRKYQSFRTPPENILNRHVFCVDTANIDWLFVSDQRPLLKSLLTVEASLSDTGKIKGNAHITFFDHSKVQRMADLEKTEEERDEEEKEFIQKEFTELSVDSIIRENAEDDLQPLTEKFNFTYQPSVSGQFLFLDPFFLSNFRKNPFTDSIRHTKIDFNSRQYLRTKVNIAIPDAYEVDHIPKNIRLRMSDSTIIFERSIYFENGKIYFNNRMEILYPLFQKEDYPGIRDFFNRLYAMVNEQIILKRKD